MSATSSLSSSAQTDEDESNKNVVVVVSSNLVKKAGKAKAAKEAKEAAKEKTAPEMKEEEAEIEITEIHDDDGDQQHQQQRRQEPPIPTTKRQQAPPSPAAVSKTTSKTNFKQLLSNNKSYPSSPFSQSSGPTILQHAVTAANNKQQQQSHNPDPPAGISQRTIRSLPADRAPTPSFNNSNASFDLNEPSKTSFCSIRTSDPPTGVTKEQQKWQEEFDHQNHSSQPVDLDEDIVTQDPPATAVIPPMLASDFPAIEEIDEDEPDESLFKSSPDDDDDDVEQTQKQRQGDCLSWSNVSLLLKHQRHNKKDELPINSSSLACDNQSKFSSQSVLTEKVNNNSQRQQHHQRPRCRSHILETVYGQVPAGQVTAIMGTSGSGKTTLLNILSGRITSNNKLSVKGNIFLNGRPIHPSKNMSTRQSIAFVAQDDSLQVTATPREAIAFSARLRLSKTLSTQQIDQITQDMIAELNLQACADTIVGGALIKGISGGERKRTSVGVELVTQPALILLDEATSGLDSFNALELCQVLKKVAQDEGSSVLMTIHQPSSEIFTTALDRLILLQHGQVMYEGPIQNNAVTDYFAERGYPCAPHYNPADWILMISQTVSMDVLQQKGFFGHQQAHEYETYHASLLNTADAGATSNGFQEQEVSSGMMMTTKKRTRASSNNNGNSIHSSSNRAPVQTIGFWRQTQILFYRELKHTKRNTHVLKTRIGMTCMISLLMSILFYQVAKKDPTSFINVQSTFGGLLCACLANIFSIILPSLVAFPEERPVFVREYSTNHYSVASYFASRFAMEMIVTAGQVSISSLLTYFMMGFSARFAMYWATLYALAMASTALGVLVGCSVRDPSLAFEFLPLLFMPQILFAGFFIPPESIPIWLRWIVYVFPLSYAIRIALVNEFDSTDDPSHPCYGLEPNNCDMILTNVNAVPDDVWWYWLVLLCEFVVCRLLALFVLQQKATKYY